jgi:cytochrome c-type biogenesis protein CcmH
MLFWFLIAAMILVLLALLSWGLLGFSRDREKVHSSELNRIVYQDQLDELLRDRERGALSQQAYDREVEEIERRILEEAEADETEHTENRASGYTLCGLLILVPVSALFLYSQIGNPSLVDYVPGLVGGATVTADNTLEMGREQNVDESLMKRYLKESPRDVRAWLQYARLLENQKKWHEALEVLDRVFELSPQKMAKSPDLVIERVLVMLQSGDPLLNKKISDEVQRVIDLNPEDPQGWELLGMIAYKNGDYGSAVSAWEKLLTFYPSGSQEALRLMDAIAAARNRQMMGGMF